MKRRKQTEDTEPRAAATVEPTPFDRLRDLGFPLALAAAVWTGWQASRGADLLEAVLRGAGVWIAVLALWIAGLTACRKLIEPALAGKGPEVETETVGAAEPS